MSKKIVLFSTREIEPEPGKESPRMFHGSNKTLFRSWSMYKYFMSEWPQEYKEALGIEDTLLDEIKSLIDSTKSGPFDETRLALIGRQIKKTHPDRFWEYDELKDKLWERNENPDSIYKDIADKLKNNKRPDTNGVQDITIVGEKEKKEINININILSNYVNHPYALVLERLCLYELADGSADKDNYVYAVWPLEHKGEDYKRWIEALTDEIFQRVDVYDDEDVEIYFILHDRDLFPDGKPFRIEEYKKETYWQEKKFKRTIVVFQHAPSDPVRNILMQYRTDIKAKDVVGRVSQLTQLHGLYKESEAYGDTWQESNSSRLHIIRIINEEVKKILYAKD